MRETVLTGDYVTHGALELLVDDGVLFWEVVGVLVGLLEFVE